MSAAQLLAAAEARAEKVRATHPSEARRLRAISARMRGETPAPGDAEYDGTAVAITAWLATFCGAGGGVNEAMRGNCNPGTSLVGALVAELGLQHA